MTTAESPRGPIAAALHFVLHEMRQMVAPVLFFGAGFYLILATMGIMLPDRVDMTTGLVFATVAALVVGKAVLVANLLPVLPQLTDAPLIRPILLRALLYWVVTLAFRALELVLHYVFERAPGQSIGDYFGDHFVWRKFVFVQIWMLVLFVAYTTATSVGGLFGPGELRRILFGRPARHV